MSSATTIDTAVPLPETHQRAPLEPEEYYGNSNDEDTTYDGYDSEDDVLCTVRVRSCYGVATDAEESTEASSSWMFFVLGGAIGFCIHAFAVGSAYWSVQNRHLEWVGTIFSVLEWSYNGITVLSLLFLLLERPLSHHRSERRVLRTYLRCVLFNIGMASGVILVIPFVLWLFAGDALTKAPLISGACLLMNVCMCWAMVYTYQRIYHNAVTVKSSAASTEGYAPLLDNRSDV